MGPYSCGKIHCRKISSGPSLYNFPVISWKSEAFTTSYFFWLVDMSSRAMPMAKNWIIGAEWSFVISTRNNYTAGNSSSMLVGWHVLRGDTNGQKLNNWCIVIICDVNMEQFCIWQFVINIGQFFIVLNARQIINTNVQLSRIHNYFKIKLLEK